MDAGLLQELADAALLPALPVVDVAAGEGEFAVAGLDGAADHEQALAAQQSELAADRRAQVGSGERAEKIRTYNFPQGRITDHRVKHSSHDLDAVLAGELEGFTSALQDDEKRRRLADGADIRA